MSQIKQKLEIVLPFPPSSNAAFGQAPKHRRYKTAEYVSWLKSCPKLPALKLDSVSITYRVWFPDERVRDTANYEKLTTDYLVSQGVIIDDNWKVINSMLSLPMGIDRKNPRVIIEIG